MLSKVAISSKVVFNVLAGEQSPAENKNEFLCLINNRKKGRLVVQLKTKHFDEISYDEEAVIIFEEGLPGFNDFKRFILLSDNSDDLLLWLQSVDDGNLAFVLLNAKQIIPDYDPFIEPDMIKSLDDGSTLVCYNIAVVPDDLRQMRVNLRAPVIINKTLRKGKQVLTTNDEYSLRHYIFEDINNYQLAVGNG